MNGKQFVIEKQTYSRSPWRVLWADDREQVHQHERFDHPELGVTVIAGPVCFDRKRDALAWVQAHPNAKRPKTDGGAA